MVAASSGLRAWLLVMMASAVISARASPANVCRTLWITDRSATIAPTPIAMQRKKNSSRRQDARISRTIIRATKVIGRRPPATASSLTERPSRSTSRASATAATFASWVTSTSVTRRVRRTCSSRSRMWRAVGAVEIPGRLVGEHQRRIVGQRARDRHALLLAARELRRIVMAAIVQPHLVEQRLGAGGGIGAARDLHRHLDVLERGQRRHQVEELEDEADLLAAQARQRVFVERGDVDAVDQDLARRRRVEPGDEPEQRGLAAARRPDDRQALAVGHVEGQRMQDGQRRAAALNGLADAAQRNHEGRVAAWSTGSSTLHTVSATRRAPSGFGWMPSA